MKVDLFRSGEFEVKWPTQEPTPDQVQEGFQLVPDEEKIVVKCKRLSHGAKRRVEDTMFSMKGSQMQRAAKSKGPGGMSLQCSFGTVKDLRLKSSITGWDNVLDKEGNPIKYRWEMMTELLACNAYLDPAIYGSLEDDLLARIDEESGFTERVSGFTGKNS